MYTDPTGYKFNLPRNDAEVSYGWLAGDLSIYSNQKGAFSGGGAYPITVINTGYRYSNGKYYYNGQEVSLFEVYNNYILPNAGGQYVTVDKFVGSSNDNLRYDGSVQVWVKALPNPPQSTGGITVPFIVYGMENTAQAIKHYYNGRGTPVTLGNKTVDALIKSKKFQYHHNRIITGQTTRLIGNFSVNLEWIVFHVGDTNVNYSIEVGPESCTVTYELFADDGFWDVDYLAELTLGKMGQPNFIPDGLGPNLERGGTPYPYIPIIGTYTFPNPGY